MHVSDVEQKAQSALRQPHSAQPQTVGSSPCSVCKCVSSNAHQMPTAAGLPAWLPICRHIKRCDLFPVLLISGSGVRRTNSYFMVYSMVSASWLGLKPIGKYFFCFEITQHSFPPGCRELTGSCSGTRGTIVGTMNTACPKSWPVHPAGTGAVWVRSTHFCTTGPLCRLFLPWSSLNQSMCLSRSLSILLCTFPLLFYCTSSF